MKTLALLLALVGQCPPGAAYCPSPRPRAQATVQPWVPQQARLVVRLEIRTGRAVYQGSGTVVAKADGEAIILTCRHIFKGVPPGAPVYATNGRGWSDTGKLVAISPDADLAAVSVPASSQRAQVIDLADDQPAEAVMVGYASGRRRAQAWLGRVVGRGRSSSGESVIYSFPPEEGDSGGGVFDREGRLAGVLWGKDPQAHTGVVVSLAEVRNFLGDSRLARWFSPGAGVKIKAKRGASVSIDAPGQSPAPTPASPPEIPHEAPPGPVGPAGPQGPVGPAGPAADLSGLEARIKALESAVKQPINFVTVNPDGTRVSKPVPLGGSIGIKIPQPK